MPNNPFASLTAPRPQGFLGGDCFGVDVTVKLGPFGLKPLGGFVAIALRGFESQEVKIS